MTPNMSAIASGRMSPPTTAPLPATTAPRFTALPPLSLYVHNPWCERKSP